MGPVDASRIRCQRSLRRIIPWIGVAAGVLGCAPDPGAAPEQGDGAPPVIDAGSDGAAPDGMTDMAPDGMPPGADHGPPDAMSDSGTAAIASCAAACDRIAACGRDDIFGDDATCRARCARVDAVAAPDGWFRCLETERACGLLHLCRLPDPPPLSCEVVCAAVGGCGLGWATAECLAACLADPAPPAFARCGEALTPTCHADAFRGCLGEAVDPDCGARCAALAGCGLGGPDCLPACLGEATSADPLARVRSDQLDRCLAGAAGCERAAACLDPPWTELDEARFCAVWEPCAEEVGVSCAAAWQAGHGRPAFAVCVAEAFDRGCPAEAFRVFDQCVGDDVPFGPDCAALCEAQALCGALPDGQRALDCARLCNEALHSGSVERIARVTARLPCAAAADCPGLVACLDAHDPALDCAGHCAALDGCGLAAADCATACDALYYRARNVAARACVAEAGADCAAMARCDPGQPIGCDVICAREAACGSDDPNCALDCDDASLADADRAARRLACTTSAALCRDPLGVSACDAPRQVTGAACLGWCRARTGCDPAAVDALVECAIACGAGLRGDEALRLQAAAPCLAADPLAACPTLDACIGPAEVDCAAWCTALGACGEAPEGCEATCAADPLTRWQAVTRLPCLAEAADCPATLGCTTSPEAFLSADDRAELCARHAACGFAEELPCEGYFDLLGDDVSFLHCVRAGLEQCPAELDGLVFDCFLEIRAGDDALPPCERLCRARSRCGALDGSIRGCAAACVEPVHAAPEGGLSAALACRDAVSCDGLSTCLRERAAEAGCGALCAQAVGCGAFGDVERCLDRCAEAVVRPETPADYLDGVARCLDGFAGDAPACAAAGAGCFAGAAPAE